MVYISVVSTVPIISSLIPSILVVCGMAFLKFGSGLVQFLRATAVPAGTAESAY